LGGISSLREYKAQHDKREDSESEMFQKAGELSDQGFGEFDVCLAVLSTTKGNLQTAKKALSKLMFT